MARSRSSTSARSRSPVKRDHSPVTNSAENTCPFLIRIFVTKGKHVPLLDFDEGNLHIRDEFQVYGWKHSTPSSLVQLLYPSFPPTYRSPLARFSFRHIYVDASQRGLYRSRDLASFSGRDLMAMATGSKTAAVSMDMELDDVEVPRRGGRKIEEKSLDGYGFITGDLLSVSLYIPEPKIPAGGPKMGLGVIAPGATGHGARSFGWGDKQPVERDVHPSERGGTWHRGEPLPPQNFPGGAAGRGGDPAGGGSWRGGPGGGGIGIRGAGRRSPERNGDRRSRSPGGRERRPDRRESWSRRRGD